jgi:O-antigen/teichoic acid export membrane protein
MSEVQTLELKRKTKLGLYWTSFNQFANYGIQFVIGVVLARLLSPEDYGITAIPTVFLAVAGVLIDSGFSNAMVRKPELTEKDLATAFYYNIAVGFTCYALLFLCASRIAEFYEVPILESIIKVTALSYLIGPFNTPQTILLKRRLDFKTPTIINIISIILMGVVGISLAYMGYGVWALVLSHLSSSMIRLLLNWYVVRWTPKAGWSKDSFNYLFGYGSKLLLVFLVDKIYNNITPLFIGKFYSPVQLGVYNRALHYAQLPSQQFTSVVQGVTFPVLSKVQDDDELLSRSYRKMLKSIAFIVFPMMILLAVLARPLVILLITDKWEACIPYLQVMCFWLVWSPIHSINLNLLMVKGRSDLFLRVEVIKKVIGFSIMAITLPMGIMYFLYGSIINSLIALVINTFYTGKLINVGFLRQMGDLIPVILLCAVTGAIVVGVTYLLQNMLLQIIIGGSVGVIVYVGISVLFKFPEIEEVKYMLKRK